MRQRNGNVISEHTLGRRQTVPVIFVQGSHYEAGFDVGRVFASLIKSYLDTSTDFQDLEKNYKTEQGRQTYDKTLANMKQRYPYYVKEIQGVADGAKVPFQKLFLLHIDNLIYTDEENRVRNDTSGCSSVAFQTADNTVLGHTEDALQDMLNHFYIMSAHIIPTPEDREQGAVEERFASLCYAGQLPGYTSGFNENGLVFSINTLAPLPLKPGNTPRTFITRKLLTAKNYDDTIRILTDEGLGIGNGFSLNMIWTDVNGKRDIYNVELAPDLKADKSLLNVHHYENEELIHCNMYQRISVNEENGFMLDSSKARLKAIHAHPSPQSREDVQNILSDTSNPDFQVFQDNPKSLVTTISAGIFDLVKMTWSLYINKPNDSEPIAVLPIRFNKLE